MSESAPPTKRQQISNDVVLATLETVLKSKAFSHSTSLRQALEFIVRKGLSSPLDSLKEYTVATELLGRPTDFDPKSDNIVRVQMHRLRDKLEEYYLEEGQQDPIRIVMPRSQYTTQFVRATEVAKPSTKTPAAPAADEQVKKRRVDWRWWVGGAILVCGLALVGIHLRSSSKPPSPFSFVWEPFLTANRAPLIVYANPTFLISNQGEFYRYDSPTVLAMPMGTQVHDLGKEGVHPPIKKDVSGPFYYFDAFSGSGEVVAAARIAQFLTVHGEPFSIKRSHIVSYSDINDSSVIFLGSGKMDPLIQKLPIAQELVFEPPAPGKYLVGTHIRDTNPPPGRPATYDLQMDAATGAIQQDYALISVLPGVSGERHVLALAGLTTLGTQAAAEYVVTERQMTQLENMWAAIAPSKLPPFFQALLEVEVRDGVPLEVKCVLVRGLNYRAH